MAASASSAGSDIPSPGPVPDPKPSPQVSELTSVERVPGLQEAPPWAGDATTRELPLPSEEGPLAPEPLFEPRWTRAILSFSVATPSSDRPVDAEALVEIVALGRPLTVLPRLPWRTLRRGVQLLVDRADALAPFARDLTMLEAALLDVVGRERVLVRSFAACPTRGTGVGSRRKWSEGYAPPPSGVPVLVVTDLGASLRTYSGERARPSEWLEFAQWVKRAGCPLLALVPYAECRLPPDLTRAMTVIPWDRTTTVAQIARQLRARKTR